MLKRLPYREAPAEIQKLIADLQQSGDGLVFEDEEHRPIACLAPLSDPDHARRAEGARKLRAFLERLPSTSPYSEEETYQHIEEAIAAIRAQDRKQAVS